MSARFPCPEIPAGAFAVAWAADLTPDRATPVRAFDEDLVVFRGSDGRVRVLHAICPHLGAHLGHSGRVVDDEVECPFHGWRFAGDGRRTAAPHAKKTPDVSVRSWHAVELHDRVWSCTGCRTCGFLGRCTRITTTTRRWAWRVARRASGGAMSGLRGRTSCRCGGSG